MRQLKISKSITTRESASLQKYLQEIGKVKLVSAEEEFKLNSLIIEGDNNAKDQLVKANLRFVVAVAKQFQGQGLSLPDLINEGNIGLIKAVHRFDATKGFKFISFAVWWIRQSILRALAEQGRLVRIPLNKVVLKKKIVRTQASMEQSLERMPSPEEVAEVMEMTVEEVSKSLGNVDFHVSLDKPVSEEDDASLIDTMENPNADYADKDLYHHHSLKEEINRSMQLLNQRQRQVVCDCYGIGIDRSLSLEEIGKKLDITVERVRQIKDRAITILRTTKNFSQLRSYLG